MAGAAAALGVVVNAPLNSRDGQATWSYIYANVSKKFKNANGARLTVGPYGVAANADPNSGPVSFIGPRGGALIGYEQPLGGPVSFVADWFSGKNSIGYFTPGISVDAAPQWPVQYRLQHRQRQLGELERDQEPLCVRVLRRDVSVAIIRVRETGSGQAPPFGKESK